MSRVLPLLLAVVVSSGAAQGLWTNRWSSPAALQRATARLADLPATVGDWDGQPGELDARQLAVAEVSGHSLRRYVNRRSGAVVSVLLVCGRPGPVSVHSPEVCYRGIGFDTAGPRVRQAAPGGDLWAVRFHKPAGATPEEHLRVLYSWNADGRWVAADNPRTAFARQPALYKLLVIRPMARGDEPLEEDPAVEFLRLFLPAVQQTLFPAPGTGPAA
jgi:hypothetical protein